MYMQGLKPVFRRELSAYFATPLAYVFIVIFLLLQGLFTFYMGQFFTREQADLAGFFAYHPWLYLFLIPAIAMRLWSEERQNGTLEILFTLPISAAAAIMGKYLAALVFTGFALFLTFPIWITVNVLGSPDNGVIIAGYLGSFLMAAAYLAIGTAMSAMTSNQVVAFILSVMVCFLFTVSGLSIVLDAFNWAGGSVVLAISNLSFLTHFSALQKGVVALSDLVYFFSMIGFWLWVSYLSIQCSREA